MAKGHKVRHFRGRRTVEGARRRRFSVRIKIAFALLFVTVSASIAVGAATAVQSRARIINGYTATSTDIAAGVLTAYQLDQFQYQTKKIVSSNGEGPRKRSCRCPAILLRDVLPVLAQHFRRTSMACCRPTLTSSM